MFSYHHIAIYMIEHTGRYNGAWNTVMVKLQRFLW